MNTARATAAQQINVADRVTVTDGKRTFVGHVARKGRTHVTVVTDDGRELRVPYSLLSRTTGAPGKHVQGRTDTLRAQFQAGERVRFTVGGVACSGVISRLNPRYAHVVCDDDREYRVPYARLTSLAPRPVTRPEAPARTDAALDAIAARARAWMAAHALEGWSFQFDHATARAGCCHYGMRVISLAQAYARSATEADITDTILHEIAHALER